MQRHKGFKQKRQKNKNNNVQRLSVPYRHHIAYVVRGKLYWFKRKKKKKKYIQPV